MFCEGCARDFLGEMEGQAIVMVLAGVVISRGGKVDEPGDFTGNPLKRMVLEVLDRFLKVQPFSAIAHKKLH